MAKGSKRQSYRRRVEGRLSAMGYAPNAYRWLAAPARLTIIVGDEMRDFRLNGSVGIATTEYELGRLDTWAEILRLKPRTAPAPRKPAPRDVMQLDMIDVAAAAQPRQVANGAA